MSTLSTQEFCCTSIFHHTNQESLPAAVEFKVPHLQHRDEEFLLGLNEILDELSPTSDHGPLSGIGLHRIP